jgi:hypothetical protein
MTKGKVHNVQVLLQQAKDGLLTIGEMKKHVSVLEDRGSPVARDAAMELRAIIQREQGKRAVALTGEAKPGSAKWAFALLGAAQVTPYRWSATTADGKVVIVLWDERGRFLENYLPLAHGADTPERIQQIQVNPAVRQNRDAFFRDLEVAAAVHGGFVCAILATAVDINAAVRQRAPRTCRPWLNEDGSPVVLRVLDLDLQRHSYRLEFAEPYKRPRCPFDDALVPTTSSITEDKMLEVYMRTNPGSYYIEVPLADGRRVDAVRIPGAHTVRIDGAEFNASLAPSVEVIEVKQGTLARAVVDQAIGSAEALAATFSITATPVAVVERGSTKVEAIARIRSKGLKVFATRTV